MYLVNKNNIPALVEESENACRKHFCRILHLNF